MLFGQLVEYYSITYIWVALHNVSMADKRNSFVVGVVGGLGPETSAKFYTKVVNTVLTKTGRQPNVVIDSVPISLEDVRMIIAGGRSEQVYQMLEASVRRLNEMPADLIVIPCNTVHIYFERLQSVSEAPMLNIIDETTREIERRGLKRIGIMATTTTVNGMLYQSSFKKAGISPVLPSGSDQEKLSSLIIKILDGAATSADAAFLQNVIDALKNGGAEGAVLGCTDLQLLVEGAGSVRVVDSMAALANATVDRIIKNDATAGI